MDLNDALRTAKAIHEAGMSVTVDLVAELQGVTHEEAHGALEALVREGRLYPARVKAAGVVPGDQNYAFASYVTLVA